MPFVSCSDEDENDPTTPGNEQKDPSNEVPNDSTPLIPSDTPDSNHPYVDLGLPSGTLWATYNVGATKPEEVGNYYGWGETKPRKLYGDNSYKYWSVDTFSKYNNADNLKELLPEDDAATVNWGNAWRMPTYNEQQELIENTYMVWFSGKDSTDVKGIIFYKAKSPEDKGTFVNGKNTPSANYSDSDAHIFLPVAGYCDQIRNYGFSSEGRYWSSSLESSEYSNELEFNEVKIMAFSFYRQLAYSVRAVRAK